MSEQPPDLLTIEEAARVLRIGRTKAYAMSQEWRVTEGESGIKVCELGGQLRVPKAWLEEQLGAPVLFVPSAPDRAKRNGQTTKPAAPHSEPAPPTEPAPRTKPTRSRRLTKGLPRDRSRGQPVMV